MAKTYSIENLGGRGEISSQQGLEGMAEIIGPIIEKLDKEKMLVIYKTGIDTRHHGVE